MDKPVRRQRRAAAMAVAGAQRTASRASARPRGRRPRSNPSRGARFSWVFTKRVGMHCRSHQIRTADMDKPVRRQRRAAAMAVAGAQRTASRASARPRGRRPRSNPSRGASVFLGLYQACRHALSIAPNSNRRHGQAGSKTAPRSGDGGRRSVANGEPSVSEAKGPKAPQQSVPGSQRFPGSLPSVSACIVDRTKFEPPTWTSRFEDSAAQRRWRSPERSERRAERQRGQGAEGPAAIRPGEPDFPGSLPSMSACIVDRTKFEPPTWICRQVGIR